MKKNKTAFDLLPEKEQRRYKAIHAKIMKGYFAELQKLIDNGHAWTLEGSVGRSGMEALENGWCILGLMPKSDYYGNRVPACFEIEDGSKGSVGLAEQYYKSESL